MQVKIQWVTLSFAYTSLKLYFKPKLNAEIRL